MDNDCVQPRFYPDYSRYNAILIDEDGLPINDIHFVQNERAEVASILGQNVALNDNFLPPLGQISEDDAFDSFIPKGVQSTDELLTYNDLLNDYDKKKT